MGMEDGFLNARGTFVYSVRVFSWIKYPDCIISVCVFWVVAARVDPTHEDWTVVVDFRNSGAFFYVTSNDLICLIYFVKIGQIAQKLK